MSPKLSSRLSSKDATFLAAGLFLLTLLFLRWWQLRYPGFLVGLDEDQIHHNYWIISEQSVLGNFVIWQLQPLLDYVLRLYVWFPILRYVDVGILLTVGFLIVAALWARVVSRDDTKVPDSKMPERGYPLALWSIVLIAGLCTVWLILLPADSQQGWLFSPSRWALISLLVIPSALAAYEAAVHRGKTLRGLMELLAQNRKYLWVFLALAFGSLMAFLTVFWFPLYGNLQFSGTIKAYYLRLSPPGVFFTAVLFVTCSWLVKQVWAPKRANLIIAGLAGLSLGFALMALKPLSLHHNYSELLLRAPSVVYSLLAVGAAWLLSAMSLGSAKLPKWGVLLGAFLSALWIVNHPNHIEYSSNARHYTFVHLVSLVWFWQAFFGQRRMKWLFWAISLLFINTHFFAIPLVLAAYGHRAFLQYRSTRLMAAIREALSGAAAVLVGLILNYPIVPYLFLFNNGENSLGFVPAISNGLSIWWRYLSFLSFPLSETLFSPYFGPEAYSTLTILSASLSLLTIGALCWLIRGEFAVKLAAYTFLLMPVVFIVLGNNSERAFVERYFSPFLGLGLVLLISTTTAVSTFLNDSNRYVGAVKLLRKTSFAMLAFSLLLLSVVGLSQGATQLIQDHDLLKSFPDNGQGFYSNYQQLLANGRAFYHIAHFEVGVRKDIPLFYFDYVDGGTNLAYILYGTEGDLDYARDIENFLEVSPEGTIVFDWLISNCGPEPTYSPNQGATVQRVGAGDPCLMKISGIEGYRQLCSIAADLNFPPDPVPDGLCSDGN